MVRVGDGLDDAVDEAYRAKYSSSPSAVSHINSAQARSTTLELRADDVPSE